MHSDDDEMMMMIVIIVMMMGEDVSSSLTSTFDSCDEWEGAGSSLTLRVEGAAGEESRAPMTAMLK